MKTQHLTWPVIALLMLVGAAHARQTTWQTTITELPLLPGGTYSSAYAINDTGKIVGVANDATGTLHTVQWLNGQISIIPSYGASGLSVPDDLNDAGEIAGHVSVSGFFSYALWWNSQNNPTALPGLPSGLTALNRAYAINASGQIVGLAREGGPNYFGHGAVWFQGALQTDLGASTTAYGINDLGAVVGLAATGSLTYAFLWQNGQFTDLSTWTGGGVTSWAYAINNQGDIVGLNASVASLWRNGSVQALNMPPGLSNYTPAIDINDAGDMIATASTTSGPMAERGVLWRNGTAIDLGTLPGGTRSRVRRINAAGDIVGEAQSASLYFRAVKWTVTAVAATTYCTAKTNSQGCTPAIAAVGAPSASNASSFTISASNVLNRQNGVFFYGFAQQIAPFQGGFKYMSNPTKRTPIQNSGGTALPAVDCSGTYSFAFNAWIQTGLDPALVVGQEVDGQFWSRDSGSPSTTGLTNAIHFVIGS